MAGAGVVATAEGPQDLTRGSLFWLPHGSPRALTAGPDGLSCLTVHRRRPGLRIRTTDPTAPADPTRPTRPALNTPAP